MKTIERYVFGAFMSSFVLAFLVLSFVLTIGLLVQIVGYIMDGVPMALVGEFCMVSLPETLQWSIPLALLVSSVLVFSRLSSDSEISAMRACGINIFSVVKWPAIFAVCCTLLGFWVNNEIVPRGHEVRRTLKKRVSVSAGLSVLEPGRVIDDFPNVKIYFERKDGNWVYDLLVVDKSNPKFDRTITADKALVTQDGADVNLELYHMTVDPMDEDHPSMARANRFAYKMKNVLKNEGYTKRTKDFRFIEMLGKISEMRANVAELAKNAKTKPAKKKLAAFTKELSELRVELNKRFVFAMASVCFVLVGIPLGIRSQRKDSTIGMAISLAVSLGYYAVVILMLSAHGEHSLRPDILIWIPVAVCMLLSAVFLRRHL